MIPSHDSFNKKWNNKNSIKILFIFSYASFLLSYLLHFVRNLFSFIFSLKYLILNYAFNHKYLLNLSSLFLLFCLVLLCILFFFKRKVHRQHNSEVYFIYKQCLQLLIFYHKIDNKQFSSFQDIMRPFLFVRFLCLGISIISVRQYLMLEIWNISSVCHDFHII